MTKKAVADVFLGNFFKSPNFVEALHSGGGTNDTTKCIRNFGQMQEVPFEIPRPLPIAGDKGLGGNVDVFELRSVQRSLG